MDQILVKLVDVGSVELPNFFTLLNVFHNLQHDSLNRRRFQSNKRRRDRLRRQPIEIISCAGERRMTWHVMSLCILFHWINNPESYKNWCVAEILSTGSYL